MDGCLCLFVLAMDVDGLLRKDGLKMEEKWMRYK